MTFDNKIIDSLIKNYQTPEEIIGENGLLKQLTKAILERCMQAEITNHLGYEKHSPTGYNSGNSRNGSSRKKLKGEFGELEIEVPRDREASYEPKIVEKGQRRFEGFDEKILSLYARGMTTREIQGHIEEMYQVEVSAGLISTVTEAVKEEVKIWQTRALEKIYPIVYVDAFFVKIREGGQVINKAIYMAIGINMEGRKEILGLWTAQTEGAKFWLQIMTELKNRGVEDIFIACVDGLKGFPEAIEAVYPQTQVQLCIVHMVRNSMRYVNHKDRKEVAGDLKKIYQSSTREEAEMNLEKFSEKWDKKYHTISKSWRQNWERITPFLNYPAEIRKGIYTTNTIESVNMSLRKIIKNRGSFPTDEAALKLLYIAIQNISKKWTMPIRDWKGALNQFSIMFEGRFPI